MANPVARYFGRADVVIDLTIRDGNESLVCPWCEMEMVPGSDARHSKNPRASTIEHVIPKDMGGADRLENLVLVCLTCNVRRGHMSENFTPARRWERQQRII